MVGAVGAKGDERARLRDAQKFEALGRLALSIAHDFNNLLLVIASHACLLSDSLPAGTRDAERAAEIRRAAERATRVVAQVLEFGRRRHGRERVDVGAVAADLVAMLRHLLGPRIEIALQRPEEPLHVLLDGGRLEQVVVNLAVNARDAMPEGGRLTLAVAAQGSDVVLSVSDTGHGIPPEVLPRIFDPLFTTKPPGHGTGLGLATVRDIVVEHGGRVAVASWPGVGTRFDVVLPRMV
jgi:signal transduction histidine kinase